jgi:hypothetical protein
MTRLLITFSFLGQWLPDPWLSTSENTLDVAAVTEYHIQTRRTSKQLVG